MWLPAAKQGNFHTANVDFRLRLGVTRVRPIASDIPWGDRTGRPRPLLIPLGDPKSEGDFVFEAREAISETSDRRLTANLIDRSRGSADSGAYVVVSEEPFAVTKFTSEPLQDRGAQDNAIVAVYDSDTRSWQLKVAAQTYHYSSRRRSPARAWTSRGGSKSRTTRARRFRGRRTYLPLMTTASSAVEFRLTPSAEIWVSPSDVELGYFLPEWASYEIFRQRGDLGLGAAMEALRAEFLYGLALASTGARNRRGTIGTGRRDRSADRPPAGQAGHRQIPALLPVALDGPRPARSPPAGTNRDLGARPSSSVPFSPAQFSDGVHFALRSTALHRPAARRQTGSRIATTRRAKPRASKYGLSGGALWPMESRNFFKSLSQNPASTAAPSSRSRYRRSAATPTKRPSF